MTPLPPMRARCRCTLTVLRSRLGRGGHMAFHVLRWRGEPHKRDGEALALRFSAEDEPLLRMGKHARRVLELFEESRRGGVFLLG